MGVLIRVSVQGLSSRRQWGEVFIPFMPLAANAAAGPAFAASGCRLRPVLSAECCAAAASLLLLASSRLLLAGGRCRGSRWCCSLGSGGFVGGQLQQGWWWVGWSGVGSRAAAESGNGTDACRAIWRFQTAGESHHCGGLLCGRLLCGRLGSSRLPGSGLLGSGLLGCGFLGRLGCRLQQYTIHRSSQCMSTQLNRPLHAQPVVSPFWASQQQPSSCWREQLPLQLALEQIAW